MLLGFSPFHSPLHPLNHKLHKQTRLGVLVAAVRIQTRHLHRQGRGVLDTRDQSARLQMLRDLEDGAQSDASALQGPIGENIAVVTLETALDIELAGAIGGGKLPLEFARAGEAEVEAVVFAAINLGTCLGMTMFGNVGGRGAEDAFAIGDFADAQIGILWTP